MGQKIDVLTAVDFSDISPAVVRSGVRLGRRLGGGCRVIHVVEALTGDEETGLLLPALRRWAEEVRREAAAALERVLTACDSAGEQAVSTQVLSGRAFSCIIAQARSLGARFIVVGGPPPQRVLGSTAERVVRKSPIPVLVVRRPPQEGYRRVLVGVDFSEGSARAWDAVLDVAEEGSNVTACHVLNTWGLRKTDEILAARDAIEERLKIWVTERPAGRGAIVRVEAGTPKTELLEIAKQQRADLLAVGSRGRSRIAQLLLGSVAEAAARKSTCDVLVAGGEREDFRLP